MKQRRVAGLSRAENENFWQSEDHFNHQCCRTIKTFLIVLSFSYNAMYLLIRYEVDLCTYVLFTAIAMAHYTCFVYIFLLTIYMVSLFLLGIFCFFVRRFRYVRKRVERLNATYKPSHNRRLARLIYDHNRVHHDLIEMNSFFGNYVGVNAIGFGALGILATFVVIHESVDWKLKLFMATALLGMYATIIAIPFGFANCVTTAVIQLLIFTVWSKLFRPSRPKF